MQPLQKSISWRIRHVPVKSVSIYMRLVIGYLGIDKAGRGGQYSQLAQNRAGCMSDISLTFKPGRV